MTAPHSAQGGLFDRFRVVQRRTVGQAADVYLAQERGATTGVEIWWLQTRALAFGGSTTLHAQLERALEFEHPQALPLREHSQLAGRIAAIYSAPSGIPISRLIQSTGPLPAERAVAMVLEALSAVQAAIDAGVAHPGLSPENIYIDRADQVMVGQFGLPLLPWQEDAPQALVQCIAPEQSPGQPVTLRAHVYAAGALLYWLITGSPPFGEEPQLAAELRARVATAPDISTVRPRTPLWVALALNQALMAQPDQRPASPTELAAILSPTYGLAAADPARPISSEFKLVSSSEVRSSPAIPLPAEPVAARAPAFSLKPVDPKAARKLRRSQRPVRRGSTAGRRVFLYATAFAAMILAAILFSGPADADLTRLPDSTPVPTAVPTPTNTPEPTATLSPNRPNVTCAYASPRGSTASGTNFVQLRGIVRDRSGKPISGAIIQVNGSTAVQMTTGAAGTFTFDSLEKGVLQIQVSGQTLKSAAYRLDASAAGPAQLYLLDWTEGPCN